MKMRFKILFYLFLVAITLNGCSLDDGDTPIINYEVIPVVSVDMPQSFTFGQVHDIPVMFDLTNNCQRFAGFEVTPNLNERTITVVASVVGSNCEENIVRTEQDLTFLAASNGTYVFKFFTGLDINNDPTFLEFDVPVQ